MKKHNFNRPNSNSGSSSFVNFDLSEDPDFGPQPYIKPVPTDIDVPPINQWVENRKLKESQNIQNADIIPIDVDVPPVNQWIEERKLKEAHAAALDEEYRQDRIDRRRQKIKNRLIRRLHTAALIGLTSVSLGASSPKAHSVPPQALENLAPDSDQFNSIQADLISPVKKQLDRASAIEYDYATQDARESTPDYLSTHSPDLEYPSFDELAVVRTVTPQGPGNFKSFMPYQLITDQTSRQFKLQQNPHTFTNSEGLRCFNYNNHNLPMIAVGTGVTDQTGDLVKVTFVKPDLSENSYFCVVGEVKKDEHTESSNTTHLIDGSVVEFIVDKKLFPERQPDAKEMGDLSYYKSSEFDFRGAVKSISVTNLNLLEK